MGTLNSELAKEGHSFTFFLTNHTKHIFKMVDNVETTTPTVEEATNGASETATEEVAAATTTENGNGTTDATNGAETKEAEAAPEKTEEEEKAPEAVTTEESKTEEVTAEGDEATKRKADEPSEEETVEKIAKLKESAAEVVSEAEKKLPEEPLTEAEATA